MSTMANGAPQTNGVGDTVPLGLYLWVSDDDVNSRQQGTSN